MFQEFKTIHQAPPHASVRGVTNVATVASSIIPLSYSTAGKAVSADDISYFLANVAVSGAGAGFYIAQYFDPLPGYDEMYGVCSVAVSLAGLPAGAQIIPFSIDKDLSLPANQTLNVSSEAITWYPSQMQAAGNLVAAFPVTNQKPSVRRYFGVAVLGNFGTAASVIGSMAIRQSNDEYNIFQANK